MQSPPPMKRLKLDLEQKKEDKPIAEFVLHNNLKITVENGLSKSIFVRLSRGQRWFVLSNTQWNKVVSNFDGLETPKRVLTLTGEKEVTMTEYEGKQYVTFHQTTKQGQLIFDTYINLNTEEWRDFKRIVPDISKALAPCSTCNKEKVKRKLFAGDRMLETMLTPGQLVDVKENNETAYNQLAYQCEYCAKSWDYSGTCHCHRFNCPDCEPGNFCDECHDITVEKL